MAKKRNKKRKLTDAEKQHPLDIRITERDDGDYEITGQDEKATEMFHRVLADKYGDKVGSSGIIPRKFVALLDKAGNPTKDLAEVTAFQIDNDTMIPISEISKPKPDHEPGQGAVQTYLYCLEKMLEGARSEKGAMRALEPGGDPERGVRMARALWAKLRNARIFEIPIATYEAFYETALDETSRKLSSYLDAPKERRDSVDVQSALTRDLNILSQDLGFPGELPFSHTYLGIGEGLPLDEQAGRQRVDSSQWDNLAMVRLLGYLLVDGDEPVVTELCFVELHNGDNFLVPVACYRTGGWDSARTLNPWVCHSMIELLNSHRVVIEQGKPLLSMKVAFKRQSKKMDDRAIPPPYYTLQMTDAYIEPKPPSNGKAGTGRALTYRHDREGHERVLVHRGPLPLGDERIKLEKRGYRITTGQLSAGDAERLSKRRKPPKRVDEWVAVKSIWIAEDIVPHDDSLPYVPAVRVPQTGKAEKIADKKRIRSIL